MKNLTDGQKVWLRGDLKDGVRYGGVMYMGYKYKNKCVEVLYDNGDNTFLSYDIDGEITKYSLEMVDFGKSL